jgi:MinD-like ATPase involved in chromosome partitioning or flagellar assembly
VVAIALPRAERAAVSAQLLEAGFEPVYVDSVDELGHLLKGREVGLAILDVETDFDSVIEMYGLLHDSGQRIPALVAVAPHAMERMRLGSAASGDEYFSRPYSAASLRWRVEAMVIRAEVARTVPKQDAGSATRPTQAGPVASPMGNETDSSSPFIQAELRAMSTGGVHNGRIVVIFNPKGGVGKTTIGVNVCAALQLLVGQRVLLVDCDTVTGHIAPSLGFGAIRTVADAWTEDAQSGRNESFRDIASVHRSGVSVLVMAQSPLHTEILEPKRVALSLTAARNSFDWVFVDMHPDYGPLNQGIFELADRIIVPVTPDVPCLRAACQFIDVARELGIHDRLLLVINRANSGVSVRDVERVVGLQATARVRSSGMLFMRAANEGQSAVERYPQAKVVGDIEGLAQRLIESFDPTARTESGLVRILSRAWTRRRPGRSLARKASARSGPA